MMMMMKNNGQFYENLYNKRRSRKTKRKRRKERSRRNTKTRLKSE